MGCDAFSRYHPAVNFIYFVGAMGFGMVFQHPAYLLSAFVGAGLYYVLLNGRKSGKLFAWALLLFAVLSIVNPLFNLRGQHVLFSLFGRPYTWEALCHGAATAGILAVMLLWFGCYNKVLTGDKFTSLFGNLIPSISLLLVMVLRMVPSFLRKTQQIISARRSIGKGAGETASAKEKLRDGMTVLSALVSWALEGSIVTGDSMRARGYGTAKRVNFIHYRMSARDWLLLAVQLVLMGIVIAGAAAGGADAVYTPAVELAALSGFHIPGFAAYCLYVLLPSLIYWKEAIQWHISRSKI